MLSTLSLLVGLSVSSHQSGTWASSSPSGSPLCGSSSSAPVPSFGRSWSCGCPFAAPTAAPGAPCSGRRTGTCRRRTGPTRCSSASMASGASRTGTGTSAPSSFLQRRKVTWTQMWGDSDSFMRVRVKKQMEVWWRFVLVRVLVHMWRCARAYLRVGRVAGSPCPSCPPCQMTVTGSPGTGSY